MQTGSFVVGAVDPLLHFDQPAHSTSELHIPLRRGGGWAGGRGKVKNVRTSLLLILDRNGFNFKYKITHSYYFYQNFWAILNVKKFHLLAICRY